MPAVKTTLPPGVRCGHVDDVPLPKGFKIDCRLGQLVDVRGPGGQRFLLAESDTHWHLHRRVTPNANGHARNHTEVEPAHLLAKDGK